MTGIRQLLASLSLLLLNFVLPHRFNLIRQFEFRSGWEILDVVVEIIRGRQRLSPNCSLAASEERTGGKGRHK